MGLFNTLLSIAEFAYKNPELTRAGVKLVGNIIKYFTQVDHLDPETAESQLNYDFSEIIRENKAQGNYATLNIGLTDIVFRDNNKNYLAKIDENQEIIFGEEVAYNTIDADLDAMLDEYDYLTLED